MTAAHPIAAGSPATKSVRRVQAATGCCRSEAGQVVGDTVWLGLLTDQSVELYQRAIDLTPGLTPCPRCMAPRRSGTSGICAGCRATMAERQRERDRGRQPKAMALWPLPEPTTPDPEAAPEPVPLLRWIVRAYSRPGDLVADPTCGTGATLIAAVAEGRRAIGWDVHEVFAARATERMRGPGELFR